jgi:hypothetical protein
MSKVNSTDNMDVSKLSNDEITALAESVFENKVRGRDSVVHLSNSSWEIKVDKRDKNELTVAIEIYSYAGDAMRGDFHNKKTGKFLAGIEELVIESPRDGKTCKFVIFDTMDIGGNEYTLYYRLSK